MKMYGYPYNNYMPQYQQPVQQAIPQPEQKPENIYAWVKSDEEISNYLVAPGKSVLLMDTRSSKFYIKSADASGMPLPLRVYEYKENTPQTAAAENPLNIGEYVKREEIDSIIDQRLNELMKSNTKKETKKNESAV